jgi:hypothetical protein
VYSLLVWSSRRTVCPKAQTGLEEVCGSVHVRSSARIVAIIVVSISQGATVVSFTIVLPTTSLLAIAPNSVAVAYTANGAVTRGYI